MLKCRVGLLLVMIVCLGACTPERPSRISTSSASASAQRSPTPTDRGTVISQPAQPATSGHKVGYETAKGWCGPNEPFPRAAVVIDAEPDGVHPTCTSLGPTQHLVVANLTNMDGYAGSRITVLLPGQPQRFVAPGAELAFVGTGDQILHEAGTTLIVRTNMSGLTNLGVTLWRVNSMGVAY